MPGHLQCIPLATISKQDIASHFKHISDPLMYCTDSVQWLCIAKTECVPSSQFLLVILICYFSSQKFLASIHLPQTNFVISNTFSCFKLTPCLQHTAFNTCLYCTKQSNKGYFVAKNTGYLIPSILYSFIFLLNESLAASIIFYAKVLIGVWVFTLLLTFI